MIKVAIVGNIASGKSTVEKILQEKGFSVYDTDIIAHKILENNATVKKELGTTDRKELAKIVFNDSQKLKILESIIHPLVKEELKNILKNEINYDLVYSKLECLKRESYEFLEKALS